jgi:broad specificity phosphatase PhoE
MPVLDIYFIRHAESEGNTDFRHFIGGRSNQYLLTERGVHQAKRLGERLLLQGIEFDRVYSSTATRASQTAYTCCRIMHDFRPIHEYEELCEISQGDWEGKLRKDFYTPEVIAQMQADNWHFKAPNGESQREVEERMLHFVNTEILPKAEKNSKIAVFSHGLSIRCLFRGLMNSDPAHTWKMELANTAITHFRYDTEGKGWSLVCFNDAGHL